MQLIKDYTPDYIDFGVETNEVPTILGEFETPEQAKQFIVENFIAMNQKLETTRLMDDYEKEAIRNEYERELEENIPIYEKELLLKSMELEKAKDEEKQAKEVVSACMHKIKTLSAEVKKGITEINLDASVTYEIPFNGNYYYYTLINGELKLAKIKEIPEFQKGEIFNSSERNKEFFEKLTKASNG